MSQINEGLGNPSLSLLETVDDAQEFLRWLGTTRPLDAISIDIETGEIPGNDPKHALSPWHGRIRTVQVGDSAAAWTIPWDEWSGVFYQGMQHYRGPMIFHNIAFESKWFATQSRWNLPWHQAHDTMLMAKVLRPNETAALKPLTAKLVDPMAAHLQSVLEDEKTANGWTWGTIPINHPAYWQYGALDCVITTRLFLDHFWPQVQPGRQFSLPYEIELQARKIATRMEVNGARVDLEYCEKKYDEIMQWSEGVKTYIYNRYGASITSGPQMGKVFAEQLGAEITKRTPSGYPSLDKEQLAIFVRDGNEETKNLAKMILDQRKYDKLASAYFQNFMDDNVDGLLHPDIQTIEARTSRMSIRNPALQTLPSGDPVVRDAFLPRNEGEVIISSDLDQVEFRLTACFSEDPALIELFHEADRTGGDVFTAIMRQVYQDDTLDKEKDANKRKLIKSTVYGKLYGAGVEKMALTAGVPEANMREVVEAFDSNYPGVKRFQKKTEADGQRHYEEEGVAYVETKTGRRLPADDNRLYALTNYKIQASAAEIFKMNLIKLDQADLTEYMVVPVHDEIVLSVPEDLAAEIMPIVKECMTTTDDWEVPLTSGVEGPFKRWGEKYHGKN